jgi:hypothetical protein
MGIGTQRNVEKSLIYCIKAGLKGLLPAILTAIALFDVYRQAESKSDLGILSIRIDQSNDSEVLELEAIIRRWETGDWGEETIDRLGKSEQAKGCHLILPDAFLETPAARVVCRKYPAIREKLCARMCTCTRPLGPHDRHLIYTICGWQLLDLLAQNVEDPTRWQEAGL